MNNSNTFDITNASDKVIEAILAVKMGEDVSLKGFLKSEIRFIMDACKISYTEAWINSCEPAPEKPEMTRTQARYYENAIYRQAERRYDGQ